MKEKEVFELVKESEKGAGLFEEKNSGVKFWVRPKTKLAFLKGNITESFKKSFDFRKRLFLIENTQKELDSKMIRVPFEKVQRETEKALAFKCEFNSKNHWIDRLLWIPKSLIKDGMIQQSFVQMKIKELNETVPLLYGLEDHAFHAVLKKVI